ncbi:winged helix-turn-helix transcriptional regulator [Caldiplasma sukawensis]
MSENDDTRSYILKLIKENPGIHFREMVRVSGLSVGQLEYHLYKMEKNLQISVRKDGKFKRYFPAESDDQILNSISFYLKNKESRSLLFYIYRKKSLELKKLREKFGQKGIEIVNSMYSDNLLIMENGVVEIARREKVYKAIQSSKSSFTSELADSFIDLLGDED